VLTATTPTPQRLLLVDLGELQRHVPWERLTLAGFELMLALNHADLCPRLLTWRPHRVIADGDLSNKAFPQLAELIRASASPLVASNSDVTELIRRSSAPMHQPRSRPLSGEKRLNKRDDSHIFGDGVAPICGATSNFPRARTFDSLRSPARAATELSQE
jgi:hypothetical protein